jgi:hypothetical protein
MSALNATVLALVYNCLTPGEVHERCHYVCRRWHSVPHPNPGRLIVLTKKLAAGLLARKITGRDNGVCQLTPLTASAHVLRSLVFTVFQAENLEPLFSVLP